MKTSTAIEHFKSAANLARALKITPQSIGGWGENVPRLRQVQLERITGGALRASPDVFERPRAQQGAA